MKTTPDCVKQVCDLHSRFHSSCDCDCTCSWRTAGIKGCHHETTCPIFFPEVPRVMIFKEQSA